jgi:ABC-type transport system involved in multi-copper enzyme maturation permease subunit
MASVVFLGALAFAGLSGGANIPAQWAAINQAEKRDEQLCRQTRWTQRRTQQLNKLILQNKSSLDNFLDPAKEIAQTSVLNWQISAKTLQVDETIYYINLGVLIVTMIIFVALAWFCLMRKRDTLRQALQAAQHISA